MMSKAKSGAKGKGIAVGEADLVTLGDVWLGPASTHMAEGRGWRLGFRATAFLAGPAGESMAQELKILQTLNPNPKKRGSGVEDITIPKP